MKRKTQELRTGGKCDTVDYDGLNFTDNFHRSKRENQAEVITTKHYTKSERKC